MTKRTPRADAATVDQRVGTIATLILNGETTSKIHRNPTVRRWNLTQRTIEEYIRKARNEITALGEFDKSHEFGRALARLDDLYSRAIKAGELSSARAILADRMKMLGIAGPIHIVTDENGNAATSWLEVVRLAAKQQRERDAAEVAE